MGRFRAVAAAMTLLALVLAVAASFDSRRLLDQVFPGFLVFDLNRPGNPVPQPVVFPLAAADWLEPGTTVPPRAVVVSVDDQPVAASAAVYATVGTRPAGVPATYRLATRYGIPHTATVSTRRFSEADWLSLHAPRAMVVVAFLLLAMAAVVRWHADSLSAVLAGLSAVTAVLLMSEAALTTASALAPIWLQLYMIAYCLLPAVLVHWLLVVLEPPRYARWWFVAYAVSLLLFVAYDAGSYYLPAGPGDRLRNWAFSATGTCLATTGVLATVRYLSADWSAYSVFRHANLLRVLAVATGLTFPGVLFLTSGVSDPRLILGWLTFPIFAAFLLRQRAVLRTRLPGSLVAEPHPLVPAAHLHVLPAPLRSVEANVAIVTYPSVSIPAHVDSQGATAIGVFRKEGEYWLVRYAGKTVYLRDTVGLHHIAELLRRPGEEIPARALVAAIHGAPSVRAGAAVLQAGLRHTSDPNGGGTPDLLLDERSKREYVQRLNDIRAELVACEQMNDAGRAETLRREMDLLNDELAGAARGWRREPQNERARLSVTKTIKAAVAKIRAEHPELHRHLSASIKTGFTCAYSPDADRAVRWEF